MYYNDLSTYMYCITFNISTKKMGTYWKEGTELRGCLLLSCTDCPLVEAIEILVFLVSLLFRKVRKEGGAASFEMGT